MQETSTLYKELLAGPHSCETSLAIGEPGVLVDELGSRITFGSTAIILAASGGDAGYSDTQLVSLEITAKLFGSAPAVGCCVASELRAKLIRPRGDIPRMARLVPYARLTDGVRKSEWIQKGIFYLDTRTTTKETELEILTLHGYDAMLKAERSYPPSTLVWPAKDRDVIYEIATAMGVGVDPRTWATMDKGYQIEYPAQYACREVLGYIAAAYTSNMVMSDLGELLMVPLNGIPKETSYLIDNAGYRITFGGERILV